MSGRGVVATALVLLGLAAWAIGLIRGDQDDDRLDDRAVEIEIKDTP